MTGPTMTEPTIIRKTRWTDLHGRTHRYLRISVTDRCNLRCRYCMPAAGLDWLPREAILSFEEITRLAGIFYDRGVRKIRFTGGEPTVRRELWRLIGMVHARCPAASLHMTTNGLLLDREIGALREAGLNGLNISLDTLDPATFSRITRRDRFAETWAGIEAAYEAGYRPLKLNCVVLRGLNDCEAPAFVELTRERELDVRFLEYMPYGEQNFLQPEYVSGSEIRQRIESAGYELADLPWDGGPARSCRVPGFAGTVGFITAVSHHFCGACDRLRLTADGFFVNCLYGPKRADLKPILRGGGSDAELAAAIQAELDRKWAAHPDLTAGEIPVLGTMSQIGG
ncbi:MAG TPA: GTP 3',8-cyclase MoaA [Gemmatimonadota bacterium]|nr:GTP 3',8-cyclase MoaA [Gemmatimonadota bacterium]